MTVGVGILSQPSLIAAQGSGRTCLTRVGAAGLLRALTENLNIPKNLPTILPADVLVSQWLLMA